MKNIKSIVFSALIVALMLTLPLIFHAIPNGGKLFSPLHLPAFLSGFILSPAFALLSTIVGLFLSALLTGMPAPFMLPQMAAELMCYALFTCFLFRFIRTRYVLADIYIALFASMIAGRAVAGILNALIFSRGEYSLLIWFTSYFVSTLPAMILQLAVIPPLVIALIKRSVIERK
ncbi:MAG TPA: ECF transporter S component [Candidatus Ornithospirochaeta avicola]|uniref:ECF transporter S component n=1 Tax=Candidatus Ornithospirochaeta avicola TaxID=2840896 RepID=A0A9D1PTC5_9SPIO|nr:ECF transporter S component [Candidatus Ornithospirochaeta avicola]